MNLRAVKQLLTELGVVQSGRELLGFLHGFASPEGQEIRVAVGFVSLSTSEVTKDSYLLMMRVANRGVCNSLSMLETCIRFAKATWWLRPRCFRFQVLPSLRHLFAIPLCLPYQNVPAFLLLWRSLSFKTENWGPDTSRMFPLRPRR